MPSVTASRVIAAPQQVVWAALADIARATRWNTAWPRVEITSTQTHGAGTTFRAHTETGDAYGFVVTEWTVPECITFTPERQENERYSITLDSQTFRLRPLSEETTLVELTARATARGLRGHFVARFFWPGYQRQGLDGALESLAELFEQADDVGETEGEPGSAA